MEILCSPREIKGSLSCTRKILLLVEGEHAAHARDVKPIVFSHTYYIYILQDKKRL